MSKKTRGAAGFLLLQLFFATLLAGCTFEDNIEEFRRKKKWPVPQVGDFEISGLSQIADGSPKQVSIRPKEGKSQGIISIYYLGIEGPPYPRSQAAPSGIGAYTLSFDVAEIEGFRKAKGLNAGILIIRGQTAELLDPVAGDFEISGLSQIADGSPKQVSIRPKEGKSDGLITVYYEGGTDAPSALGAYAVTFDITESLGFNAARGLGAGTLTIEAPPTFTSVADFGTWLAAQPSNTAATPYTVELNVADLSGISNNIFSGRYVSLDLSGSTFTSIGDHAFAYCWSLASVTIPDSVTSIGDFAFNFCTSLASVTIPNSVTSIGGAAFQYCSLTSVTIPESVMSIGDWAFYYCYSLTSVTFEGTIPSSGFDYDAFGSYGYMGYLGDLRAKFYATDPTNGTPGTYTTTAPVGSSSVWTKQP
ncbi:MAG: leucine-rich repeat protein [Treponema sp.]|nr:leucine-rich repeat protein [Treponema sp.]